MSNKNTRTRIVATVGPASDTREKLLELIMAGVDVFRLNFSHGTHESHLKVIQNIREINKTFGFNVAILQDLQGPKIRLGEIEGGAVEIVEGDEIVITTEKILGNKKMVGCVYQSLAKDVKAGDAIMVDDGKIELRVFKIEGNQVFTKVVFGGLLKSKKGINLPDTEISESSLTRKDKEDAIFGLEQDVDWIALSFVRSAGDIIELKNMIRDKGKFTKVIAKIERPEAIRAIDKIVEAFDGLMVARGDLGVEVQMEKVPMYQKRIVELCNKSAKPVIIATQMMETMIDSPRPTRAEVNDVANAVYDGADAVMLSGETAAGKFPVQVIQVMNRILGEVEREEHIYNKTYDANPSDQHYGSDRIVAGAVRLAEMTNAKALVGLTSSGFTAFKLARHRPKANIFIFTSNKFLLPVLNLVWGVKAYYYSKFVSTDETFADIEDILVKDGHLRKGDVYINIASMPMNDRRKTNMMKYSVVN
jgi:pyruvate kinase